LIRGKNGTELGLKFKIAKSGKKTKQVAEEKGRNRKRQTREHSNSKAKEEQFKQNKARSMKKALENR
jgi:hypothetical protein